MNPAPFQAKSRQEVLQALARNPASVAEYALQLQAQLAATEQALTQQAQLLAATRQELTQQEQLLAEARAYIAQLKRQLFGPTADRLTAEQEAQLRQLSGDVQEQAQRPPPVSRAVLEGELPPRDPEKARRPRRPPMAPVPLEVLTTTLEPPDKTCAHCQRAGQRIGQEITTEYDYLPAKLICRQTIRPKYARVCGCTGPAVTIAPLPPRLVPQSKLGLGLAVHLLLSRFDDHMAYYTLERIFRERHGVIIPRAQLVQWVEQIAFLLLAIYNGIWEELQATGYLQVDETPVKVLDPEVKGQAATGYLWFYAHPQTDVLLEFCDSRGRAGPQKRLQGFAGTIQTDAYGVYESLRRERPATLRRLGCLSHARRRFYTAAEEGCRQAIWFIAQIRQLYLLEDEVRQGSDAERKTVRRARAPACWRALKQRALQLQAQPGFLPKSSLGKAVNYFLKEYTALVGYLRDGRFEVDNNLVENDVRPSVVGRKRWLFIGHPDAGWRSAVLYTIIQSCRRRGINPQDYLTDVLRRLPSVKNHEVKDLLPSRWQPLPSQPP
jgi:transposase